MLWTIVIVIGFVAISGCIYLVWDLKNAPIEVQCSLCGCGGINPDKVRYMRKGEYDRIAVCSHCLSKAVKQGFEVYKVGLEPISA